MSVWTKQKFGDFYLTPSRNGVSKPSRVRGTGYSMVNMKEIFANDRIVDELNMELVPLTESEAQSGMLQNGDLLFARQSLVIEGAGKCSIYLGKERETTFESHLIRVRLDSKISDPMFYYYYFSSSLGKSNVRTIVNQVAAAGIRGSDLERLLVPVTDLPTQTRIASVLSAYDELIENNEKRIKALEEMAQLLYTEWFTNLNFPGHETYKVKDKIPEGFNSVYLADLVDFVRGTEPGSLNYKNAPGDDLIPFLRVGDLGTRNSELYIHESLSKGKIIERKDIAVSMDGTVGRVVIGMSGAYSTGIRKLVIRDQRVNREFLYCLMLSDYIQDIIKAYARGAVILHASESIKHMRIILPTTDVMGNFEKLAKPMIDEILNLQDTIRTLSHTRDLLIPLLVTGKRELK